MTTEEYYQYFRKMGFDHIASLNLALKAQEESLQMYQRRVIPTDTNNSKV